MNTTEAMGRLDGQITRAGQELQRLLRVQPRSPAEAKRLHLVRADVQAALAAFQARHAGMEFEVFKARAASTQRQEDGKAEIAQLTANALAAEASAAQARFRIAKLQAA